MDKKSFSRFEERIQSLVEGGFARLFAGRLQPRDVALRLARVMEDEALEDENGMLTAPNRYVVHLNPSDHSALFDAEPNLAAALADHVVWLARESDLRLDQIPEIELVEDAGITTQSIQVEAFHTRPVGHSTQAMTTIDDRSEKIPTAFLVAQGNRYLPLDRAVTNIGRRRDNTIVLDDSRVSRQHCQIRFRFGQFVLYDLGSRGGTFLNNMRITESVLRPGDVISLAGVQLVYMMDDSTTGRVAPSDTQVNLRRVDEDGSVDR
jgi:hypothetical protein